MSTSDRCVCPDCGASHRRRSTTATKDTRPSRNADTDLNVTRCHHCHTPVLAGHIEGIPRHLDPDPLTDIGVLAYRPTRRALCTVTGSRGRNLSYAFTWPPKPETTVHVEHACGKTVPPELRAKLITRKKHSTEFPDTPPY